MQWSRSFNISTRKLQSFSFWRCRKGPWSNHFENVFKSKLLPSISTLLLDLMCLRGDVRGGACCCLRPIKCLKNTMLFLADPYSLQHQAKLSILRSQPRSLDHFPNAWKPVVYNTEAWETSSKGLARQTGSSSKTNPRGYAWRLQRNTPWHLDPSSPSEHENMNMITRVGCDAKIPDNRFSERASLRLCNRHQEKPTLVDSNWRTTIPTYILRISS